MATDTTYQFGDSDNNLLRKLLTRTNDGVPVTGLSIDEVTITEPIEVFPKPGETFPVSIAAPLTVSSITNPVVVSSVTNPVVVSSVTDPVVVSSVTNPVVVAEILGPVTVTVPDTLDAFTRLRVASPTYLFDSQLTYSVPSLIYESITNGSGAAIAHDATNRCATMTFASTPTGGKAFLQSFEHIRYQPGRSHEIFITFNFIAPVANVTKFVGYSDGVNGVELQQAGTTTQLVLYSTTSNGNQTAAQASWNVDPMDGTGPSGITLDLTKAQILVIDMQALYVGRVRVGFDIGGSVIPVHTFMHANLVAFPYIQTANLPIRAGMTCTGTVSTTMRFICASVSSNGGQEDAPGYSFTVEGTGVAGNGTATHLLSVRPTATFNGITNRFGFILESLDFVTTGNNPVSFELVIGQVLSGSTGFNPVNSAHSGAEFNTAGTLSGSPSVTLAGGYCPATATTKGSALTKIEHKFPITLDAAGAPRANGTVSVLATGIGGVSACRVRLNWREIR